MHGGLCARLIERVLKWGSQSITVRVLLALAIHDLSSSLMSFPTLWGKEVEPGRHTQKLNTFLFPYQYAQW